MNNSDYRQQQEQEEEQLYKAWHNPFKVQHNKLNDKLRVYRQNCGLTFQAFANQCQISKSAMWELENKKDSDPKLSSLLQVAKVMGVSIESLIDDTQNIDTVNIVFMQKVKQLSANKRAQLDRFLQFLLVDDAAF